MMLVPNRPPLRLLQLHRQLPPQLWRRLLHPWLLHRPPLRLLQLHRQLLPQLRRLQQLRPRRRLRQPHPQLHLRLPRPQPQPRCKQSQWVHQPAQALFLQ